MKSSTALLGWVALLPLITAAGKRKTTNSRNAHLPAFEKATYSGYGMTADQFWTGKGCEESSSFEFQFTDSSTEECPSNGKPSKTTNMHGYGEMELWTESDETSAIHTFAYFYVDKGAVSRFSISKKSLKRASINVNAKTGMYLVEACTKFCDPDGYECYYTDCRVVTNSTVPVTVRASLTASDVLSSSNTKGKDTTDNYTKHYSSKYKERPTSVASLSVTLDGKKIGIPKAGVYTNSYLQWVYTRNVYEL